MNDEEYDPRELLGEARAIHLAMRHGLITYQQAKLRVKPILKRINTTVKRLAKECGVRPKYIRFQDLGRNL